MLNVRASQFQEYQLMLNLVAGVVFLSCPHGTDVPELLKENIVFLLKQYSSERLGNQVIADLKHGTEAHLLGVHRRFSAMSFGFDILSIYQTRPHEEVLGSEQAQDSKASPFTCRHFPEALGTEHTADPSSGR